MAKELGDLVKMNSPVYRIDQTGDMIVVETLDKQTYKVSAQEDKNDPAGIPYTSHNGTTLPLNSCDPLQADVRRSRRCTLKQKSCVSITEQTTNVRNCGTHLKTCFRILDFQHVISIP